VLADLPFQSLRELARQLDTCETTSVEIVEACLANIDAQDAKLHAFVEVWRDDALRLARAADLEREAGCARSRLHGLPIAIKDLFHFKGARRPRVRRIGMGAYRARRRFASSVSSPPA